MSRVMICNECEALIANVGYGDDCPKCGASESIEFTSVCADCGATAPRSKTAEVGLFKKKCYCDGCVAERLEWFYAYKNSGSVCVQLLSRGLCRCYDD